MRGLSEQCGQWDFWDGLGSRLDGPGPEMLRPREMLRCRPLLAGLEFGAEPVRRAPGTAEYGLTRGQVLEAHGQGA